MNQRDALYYIMTGEHFRRPQGRRDGPRQRGGAAQASCARARRELAEELLGKNPTVLRAAKTGVSRACRTCPGTTPDDYLMAKSDQARFLDPEKGREQGPQAVPG